MSIEDQIKRQAKRLKNQLSQIAAPPMRNRPRLTPVIAFAGAATLVVAVGLVSASLFGAGSDAAAGTSSSTSSSTPTSVVTSSPEFPGEYRGTAILLDAGDGAMVCLAVEDSLPPQCSGPTLLGLDWDDVAWAEEAQGVRWADAEIQVRVDDGKLVLSDVPGPPNWEGASDTDFTPPCPPPTGGWTFTEGPLANQAAFENALSYINAQSDLSGVWVYNLVGAYESDQSGEFGLVVVGTFSGDLESHRVEIEKLWQGPLCLVQRDWTETELRTIQDAVTPLLQRGEVPGLIGFGFSSVDIVKGHVEVGALIMTAESQEWLNERFGPGVVHAVSMLEAVS